MAAEITVDVRGVRKEYVMGAETVHALAGVDLQIRKGEYISIMGPSGSGKSTLFNMIGGLDTPTAGNVLIDNVDLNKLEPRKLAWVRCNKLGYIFQTFNLIPVLTALENVTLPICLAGVDDDEANERGTALLERVGLGERLDHRPTELSGGQQQRVAMARALANNPAIILADEPTGNLDLNTGKDIIDLLKSLNREHNVTIISATHDLKMLDVSDRIVWIRDGAIDHIESREDVHLTFGDIKGEA